jgi:hypothetical protein
LASLKFVGQHSAPCAKKPTAVMVHQWGGSDKEFD